MSSKIVFIDVDGTLVDYEGRLPDSAAFAVRKARANGHKVFISTGRSKAEVYDYIWNIGIDGMIGGNGSYVENNGEVIMHRMLSLDDCKNIVDYLHSKQLEFYLESNNGLFASENFEIKALPAIIEYAARKGKSNAPQMTVREAFPDMIYGGELYRSDVNKISYLLTSYNDFTDVSQKFPHLKSGTWGGAGETALFGDLGVENITKAQAIEKLLENLGADVKDTVAIGDAKVDIPMLEYCATGVAMGNGGDEIKAMADFITEDVNADGLKKAFEKLNLI